MRLYIADFRRVATRDFARAYAFRVNDGREIGGERTDWAFFGQHKV
jgi:hypothetical protein